MRNEVTNASTLKRATTEKQKELGKTLAKNMVNEKKDSL